MYYYAMLALAAGALAFCAWLLRSKAGYYWQAASQREKDPDERHDVVLVVVPLADAGEETFPDPRGASRRQGVGAALAAAAA